MNIVSKKLFLVVACTAVLLAGCVKKPQRPDPRQTVLGPQVGGDSLNPSDVAVAAPEGLDPRGDGFDLQGQNRELLKEQTVYFDFDSSAIKAPERAKLQLAKDILDKNPDYRLLLEGHCDWRGTAEYNLGLGDRRANAVKAYLGTIGVAGDKLETLSKGSLEAKQGDEAAAAKDRRVELVILKK